MRRASSYFLTAFVSVIAAIPAFAATITANTGGGLPWESSSTWQGGAVPMPGDDVVIPGMSSVVISATTGNVTVNNLTIQGGISPSDIATLQIGGAVTLTVNGDLSINQSAGTAHLNWTDSSPTVDVNTGIYGDGEIAFGATGGTLNLAGDFAHTGTFNANGGTVVLDGTAIQTWVPQTTFNNLTITNSFADAQNGQYYAIIFMNGAIVNGTLSLQGGIVDSSSSGFQTSNPISRTSGHIYGWIDQFISGGNSVTLPLGDSLNYTPIDVTTMTSGSLSASTFDFRYTTAGPGSLQRYWEMYANDVTITSLTFHYADVDVQGDEQSYVLGRFDGTNPWLRFGPTTFNTGTNTIGYSNATPFPVDGYWTAGEAASVTTATKLAITTINNGVTPKYQNTPFELVIEAQDNSGNPATIDTFTNITLTASGGTGTLSDIEGNTGSLAASMPAGTITRTYFDLLYSAADTVSLIVTDVTPGVLPGDSESVSFSPPQSQLTVTTNANYGLGSLRHAINTVNSDGCAASPCPINFNIAPAMADGDGIYRITVTGSVVVVGDAVTTPAGGRNFTPTTMTARGFEPLPSINNQVTIDGTTQPEYNPADPAPVIELVIHPSHTGLDFVGGAATVRALAIHGGTAMDLGGDGNHRIEGCYLGLKADGTVPNGGIGDTATGLRLTSTGNIIGGLNGDSSASAAKRNVIGGATNEGILLEYADDNNILGNYIGTDPAGMSARPNGVGINTISSSVNVIGDVMIGARNVISGNTGAGILMLADTVSGSDGKQNYILGNYIGVAADGTSPLPNTDGIYIDGNRNFENVIGGMTAGEGNVIARNSGRGVVLLGDTYDNVIFGNSFFENGGIAIDHHANSVLDTNDPGDVDANNGDNVTANNGQNRPVINRAEVFGSDLQVDVTVDSQSIAATQSIRVEVFKGFNGQPKFYLGGSCFATNFVNDFTVFLTGAGVVAGDQVFATANSFTSSDCSVSNAPGVFDVSDGASEYSDAATASACSPPPNMTVTASGPTTFCDGQSVTLNAPTILGYSYQWYESGTPINGQTSFSLNVTTSGSYTVEITYNGCSAMSSATPVTVNPVPSAPSASNTGPYCDGGTIQLNASFISGASYAWTGPNGFTSTLQNPTVPASLAAAGTYNVTATVNSCTSAAGQTTVVVNSQPSAPSATNGGPYCETDTIQLNASFISGASYAWTGPNGFTSTAQNPTLTATALAAGVYNVTATVNGCTSGAGSTTVIVNASPATTASNSGPYCENDTIQLNATFVSGASYAWTGPNGFTSNLQNPTLTATTAAAGNYTVTATVGSCTSAPSSTTVAVNATPVTSASNTGPYCENATIQLNAGFVSGASYSWTGPNGFTSNLQDPTLTAVAAAAGNYTVTATVGACASAPVTTTVVITPPPAPPAASNTGPYCEGSTIQLNASLIGGATYSWTGPNGFTSNLQNPTLTASAAAAGVYNVTATVSGCTSTSSSTTVVVNSTPAAPVASNGGAYCEGATIELFASTVAGATYQWTGPNGFTSSLQNPTLSATVANAGIYNVSAVVNGCASSWSSTEVIVNNTTPSPTASNAGPYCEGATIQLNASTVAGATYSWSGPNGFTSNAQNPTLPATTAAAGTYTVIATVNGCGSASSSTTVVVNPSPAAPVASNGGPYCDGATIQLNASTIAGAAYSWTGPNGFTSTLQNPTLTASQSAAGSYNVFVLVNGCASNSASTTVVVNSNPNLSINAQSSACAASTSNVASVDQVIGAAYNWTITNGIITSGANTDTITYTAGSTGTTTLNVTVTTGACSSNGTKNVTITSSPTTTITAPSEIVAETTGNASIPSPPAGATVTWTITNGILLSGQGTSAITFEAGASGSVGINVTVEKSGCVSTGSTSVPITKAPGADLQVTKSAPASVAAGEAFSYTITIYNAGPETTTVLMTDTFPAGLELVSTSTAAGNWNCTGSNSGVNCNGTLSSGATQIITLNVNAPDAGGTITNNVSVTAQSTSDPDASNNFASATTNVVAQVTCATTPPSLLSPANNATVTSPVAFSWSAVTGATLYELWITSNGSASLAGTTSSTALTAAVPSGTSSWYVTAQLASGCDALVSSSRTFTVATSNNCDSTAAPTINAPAQGATVSSPVTVSWNAVPQAVGYRVWISDDGGALQDIGTTNGALSLLIAAPAGNITLYVDALFGGCPARRSSAVNFTVPEPDPCASRGSASPLSPANNATLDSSHVTFTWSAAPNADGYRLWASINGAAAVVLESTEDTSTTEKLDSGFVTWWVETLYDGCASTESQRRNFTLPEKQNCGTAKPSPVAPANNTSTTLTSVTFTWTNIDSDAVGYEVWLALNNGTPALLASLPAGTTSVTKEVPAGTLNWFVRALVDRCPSRDSQTFTFTVTPPAACETNRRPLPATPADGNEVTSPVNFTFSTSEGATLYEVLVARGNGAPAVVGSSTTGEVNGISLPTGSARWFVRAHFGASCPSLDSEEVTFKVVPRPDACAALTPPVISAPGQISADTQFRIQWTPEPAATQYQLQIADNPNFDNASLTTTSATASDLTQTNTTGDLKAVYARVRAIDTRCQPSATVSAYGPVSVIFILPQQGEDGSVDLAHGDAVIEYSIQLGPEYAGQTFSATSKDSFLTIIPANGVVPPAGISLLVRADTSTLPVGATLGSVTISLSGPTFSSNATSVILPISINLVTPVAPTTKDTPPPDAMIIPAVASAAGINALFESDVRVSNTSPRLVKYQLTFVPTGEAGMADGKQTTFSVEPGRTIALDDILKTWFGAGDENTVGSLEIRPLTETSSSTSSSALGALANVVSFASSRTFNVTPNGTFGQFIPAVPFANFLGKESDAAFSDILSMQQISQSDKFRTNIGFVEGSGEKVELLVSVFGSNGALMGTFPVSLNGGQHTQLNMNQQGFDFEDGRVEVQVTSGGGKITAYASVLDNATADAILVTPVTLSQTGNTKWVIPGVADVASGFANWKTDMRVFNAGTEPVDITASFYSQNGGAPKVNTLTIDPGQVKQLDKVLATFFNAAGDAGAIHLSTDNPERVIATARTYNETSTGSYGLFASAVTPAEAVGVGSRPLQLLQVEESTRFRSNIGFAEVTGRPVTLEVTIVPPDAKFSATVEVSLNANEFRQIGSLLGTLGLGETHNARISVRAISGEGRATAYAAVIDMKTNDPTYVPAQ